MEPRLGAFGPGSRAILRTRATLVQPVSVVAEQFAEGAGRELSAEEREVVARRIDAALAEAREHCPRIGVSDADLARYAGERLADEEDPVAALEQRYLAELCIACGCARGDVAAIEVFERACLGALGPAIRRIDPTPELLDEVRQQMRVSMLVADGERPPRIAGYRGTGRLTSWIRVAAVREALEILRKARGPGGLAANDDPLLDVAEADDDPELRHIRQLYRSEFRSAFGKALADLESRERNLLRLHLVDGSSIDDIGVIYRVHRATAARWIARAREKLLDRTRARLSAELALSPDQFDSLMGVVRSHLDLSIERLLTEARSRSQSRP